MQLPLISDSAISEIEVNVVLFYNKPTVYFYTRNTLYPYFHTAVSYDMLIFMKIYLFRQQYLTDNRYSWVIQAPQFYCSAVGALVAWDSPELPALSLRAAFCSPLCLPCPGRELLWVTLNFVLLSPGRASTNVIILATLFWPVCNVDDITVLDTGG